jgi:hypothetical protein
MLYFETSRERSSNEAPSLKSSKSTTVPYEKETVWDTVPITIGTVRIEDTNTG